MVFNFTKTPETARCAQCHQWFPVAEIRGAHEDGRGPGVCPACYAAIKAERDAER